MIHTVQFGGLVETQLIEIRADRYVPFEYNNTLSGMQDAAPAWMFLGAALCPYRIETRHDVPGADREPS
jgi:hypothetical protein